MNCPGCQRDTIAGAYFCHSCGGMLRPFCRPCRLPLPANSAFCYQCGTGVGALGASNFFAAGPTPPAIPSQNLNSPPAPLTRVDQSEDGERKLVSVVFADISGFTALSEKLDPEKITDLMNACFDRLGKVVFKYEGYIDKFMGDCIMALFGAPTAHENDPELALRCAMGLIRELELFNQETGNSLRMSIGINSGMVIAGNVGTERKREYTVMGDAVNTAQRLQSIAKPGQILVSREILKFCEKLFDFNLLSSVQMKGKEESVEVFEAIGERIRKTDQDEKTFKLKSFIGRRRELEIVGRCLESLQAQQGQILAVSGEPGVGKSRMKLEIKLKVREMDLSWHETKCFILTKDSAYHNFRELIQSMISLDPNGKDPSQASLFLQEIKLDPASEYLIRDLIGLPDSRLEPLILDAQKKKKALFLAVKKLILALSHRQKVILYFEDLHWMDALSLELLNYLIGATANHPLMIYASFRPDFAHEWSQHSNFNQISLSPLSVTESMDLVKELLGFSVIPPPLEKLIKQRADGNPLYIEEIIKSLIESEDLQKNGSVWKIVSDLSSAAIPSTVQGLIASRIDKLDETEKLFLQYASVIGREFSTELLDIALGGRPELDFILNKLKRRELIHERHHDAERPSYIFKHALTQEVAYNSILKKKRRLYHERVALAIEHRLKQAEDSSPETSSSNEFVEMLAYHFAQAEITSKAIHYLSLAGDKLKASYNYVDAIKSYKAAIELIDAGLDISEEESKSILNLLYEVAYLQTTSAPDESEKYFRKILVHPQSASDPIRKARVFRQLSEIAKGRGRIEEAIQFQEHALEVSKKFGDHEGEIRTFKTMGTLFFAKKDCMDQAIFYLTKGLEGARQIQAPILIAEFLNDLSILHIERNKLDEAETALAEVAEIAKNEKRLISVLINSTINRGVIHYYRKDFIQALKAWEESSVLARKLGDLKNQMISRHNVGEVFREFGKFDEALEAFEESYQVACDLGYEPWQINNQVLMGYITTRKGQIKEGLKILEEVMERARDRKLWAYYCDALYYLGCVYREEKEIAKALEALRTGLQKAKELNLAQFISRYEPVIEEIEKEKADVDTSDLAKTR